MTFARELGSEGEDIAASKRTSWTYSSPGSGSGSDVMEAMIEFETFSWIGSALVGPS